MLQGLPSVFYASIICWHFTSFTCCQTFSSTCSQHFLQGFHKSGLTRRGGDRPYIKNTSRLSQGSDGLTAVSFKRTHPSSLLFLPLFLPAPWPVWAHSSSHMYNSSVLGDAEPDRIFFSFLVLKIPLVTRWRSRWGKVFNEIFFQLD